MILDPFARNSTGSRGESSQVPVNRWAPRTCHAPEVRWGEEVEMQDQRLMSARSPEFF